MVGTNGVSLDFALTVWGRTVETQRKTGLGLPTAVRAAGARATTQTGQVCDSALLAWWCATTAAAVHTVSSRHSSPANFVSERIPRKKFQYYTLLQYIGANVPHHSRQRQVDETGSPDARADRGDRARARR